MDDLYYNRTSIKSPTVYFESIILKLLCENRLHFRIANYEILFLKQDRKKSSELSGKQKVSKFLKNLM